MPKCPYCKGKGELEKLPRTHSQNAYYWAYLRAIELETGNIADDLHEYFRRKLLPPQFISILDEEIKIARSTRTLDKYQWSEYLDKISSLTSIPLPSPEAAGYISNT